MNEKGQVRDAAIAAASLRRELEANDRAARQFLSSASLIQSAYSQALDRVNAALGTLRQSLTAVATVGLNLFSGMLNAIQPAVQRLSQLVVKLFGVTVWQSGTKAAEGTASALNKVARSTRSVAQAQRDLYSFDEITRVSAQGNSGSSSGSGTGGSGGGTAPAGEGTLIRVSGLLDRWARQAKAVLAQIWQPFQAAWDSQGAKVLQAARTGLEQIVQAAAAVGRSWLNIWTDGTGETMVTTVLQTVRSLCQAAGELAGRFRLAWEQGGAGSAIFRGLLSLGQSFLDCLRNMASATAVWASKLDFGGLVQGFARLIGAAQPLAQLLAGGLSWGYQNVLLPLAGWMIQSAGPAMLNVLTGAVNLLTAGLNLLKPIGTAVWEYVLKPMGAWTGGVLITSLNAAANGVNTLASAIQALPAKWESLKERTTQVWTGIRTSVLGAANSCQAGTSTAFAGLSANALNQSNGLKKSLKTVFGDIVSSVKSKLEGIRTALTSPVRNGLNGVIELVNRVIRKINQALKFSWDPIKVLGKVIAPGGSVTIAKLPTVSKLAEGGVTLGPTFSLIGEAGREAVLPLDRNTGWMDQLAARLGEQLSRTSVTGGETVIEVYVGGERLTRQVVQQVNDLTRRTGRCPICI